MISFIGQWLSSKKASKYWKAIEALTELEKTTLFSAQPLKFGTAGVRGPVSPGTTGMNDFTYASLAIAFAKHLKLKYPEKQQIEIVIGHDTRSESFNFQQVLVNQITNLGVKVYLIAENHTIPVPILSFLVNKHKLDGGIMITASHNPLNHNGFKAYIRGGRQIWKDDEKSISNFLTPPKELLTLEPHKSALTENIRYFPQDFMSSYLANLSLHLVNIKKEWKNDRSSMKILFNGHQGTTEKITLVFLKELGFLSTQEFIHPKPYPHNTHLINPEHIDSFSPMINSDFQYLCAQDPDGDRATLMEQLPNGEWHHFTGNELGIILSYNLSQYTPSGHVISTYVSTTYIDNFLPENQIHRVHTGFKNMSKKWEELNESSKPKILLSFEEAIGASIHPINMDKDGFQYLAELLGIASQQPGHSLMNYLQQIYSQYGTPYMSTTYIKNPSSIWREHFNKNIGDKWVYTTIDEVDCWTLNPDNWVKFRTSGTGEGLKMYINTMDQKIEKALKAFFN